MTYGGSLGPVRRGINGLQISRALTSHKTGVFYLVNLRY